LPWERSGIGGKSDGDLAFQDMYDGSGIQAASTAQKQCALQKAHIRLRIQAITALGALRSNEAKLLPRAER
jgi:hypothetical protein